MLELSTVKKSADHWTLLVEDVEDLLVAVSHIAKSTDSMFAQKAKSVINWKPKDSEIEKLRKFEIRNYVLHLEHGTKKEKTEG